MTANVIVIARSDWWWVGRVVSLDMRRPMWDAKFMDEVTKKKGAWILYTTNGRGRGVKTPKKFADSFQELPLIQILGRQHMCDNPIGAPLDGGAQYENISVSIFNRHGERVYKNEDFASINDENQGWDGVNNSGQQLASGVYFYIIQMENPASNESQTLQGNITINTGGL